MKIAIFGASRGCGLRVVEEAASRGHEVVALSRTRGAITHKSVSWIAADARDASALVRALAGCDAVVSTIGRNPTLLKRSTLFSAAARALVPAMESAGIARLIAVTGIGAGDSRGHGSWFYNWVFFPLLLRGMYADKDLSEAIVCESRLNWTVVRPGILTNGKRTGQVRAMTTPDTYRPGSISRADVAVFILDCLEQRSFVHQTPLILSS
jgi:putative NADH-flavin reductase